MSCSVYNTGRSYFSLFAYNESKDGVLESTAIDFGADHHTEDGISYDSFVYDDVDDVKLNLKTDFSKVPTFSYSTVMCMVQIPQSYV